MANELGSLVEKFVQAQRQEKGERTYETYGRKIFVFQEYMERLGVNDENYRPFLLSVQISHILDAVEYYVSTYGIKYKSTTDTFMSVLTVFFKYLILNEGIKNEYFSDSTKGDELRAAYDKLAKRLKLEEGKQALPLTKDECDKLIKLCNKRLDEYSIDEIINGYNNGIYTSYISSLIVKFVLLFGIKNQVVLELDTKSYDCELNKIIIHGYHVHLPDDLARQMKRYYCEVRKKIVPENISDDRLFVDIVPGQELDNAKMFSTLKAVTGHSKAMSVAKYAIMQMLKNGVPMNLVMEFTGCAREVCGHCQELLDEEKGVLQLNEKNRKLDVSLRQSDIYDEL